MPLRTKDFAYGKPVSLALNGLEPKEVQSNFGRSQMVFNSTQGPIYLESEDAENIAERVRTLGIQAGEAIRLTRIRSQQGGSYFTVERDQPAAAAAAAVANGNGHAASPVQPEPPAGVLSSCAARMMACFKDAIDAMAEAQTYADRRGLKVTFTSEDVRACALTCYINACKEGR